MIRSLLALAALLLACAALAAPAPMPFATGWGNPVDPDNDCKIRRDMGALIIEMPGSDHDYDPSRKRVNAPRLLREIEGNFELQVRVRIDCLPSAQSTVKDQPSYVSAGFLLIPPDDFLTNCIRLEYRVAGQGHGTDGYTADIVRHDESGGLDWVTDNRWENWPFKAKPENVYLRLQRQGEILHFKISSDGKKWVTVGGGQKIGLPARLKVGFVACSTSTDPSKVRFDQLTLNKDKKRESWEFVSAWDNPVDLDKDCKIGRAKDTLTIEIPGRDHDYDPIRKRFNAPRLLSDLEAPFDLEVRVKIDYRPSAQSTVKGQPCFVSAGFLLIHPETERFICERLEYAVSQQGYRRNTYAHPPLLDDPRRQGPAPQGMEADGYAVMKRWLCEPKRFSRAERDRQRKAGKFEWDREKLSAGHVLWERGWQNWPPAMKTDYAYLRLEQREEWSCFYISPDVVKWTPLTHQRSLPKGGKVGLAAYSTSTEPSKVIFDRLKLARGKKNER